MDELKDLAVKYQAESDPERKVRTGNDLARELYPRLFKFLSWKKQSSDVGDLVQDALLLILRKIESFDPARGRFVGWWKKIAENLLLSEFRAKQRREARELSFSEVQGFTQEEKRVESEIIQQKRIKLAKALLRLKKHERRVIRMRFFNKMSWKAIAKKLGKSESAAKMEWTRAKAKLEKHL